MRYTLFDDTYAYSCQDARDHKMIFCSNGNYSILVEDESVQSFKRVNKTYYKDIESRDHFFTTHFPLKDYTKDSIKEVFKRVKRMVKFQ